MAAAEDNVIARLRLSINTEAKPHKRRLRIKRFKDPRCPHAFDVDGQRQPPTHPTLQFVLKSPLLKKLSSNALWNAKRLNEIMEVEFLRFCFVGTPHRPSTRNEHECHIWSCGGFKS